MKLQEILRDLEESKSVFLKRIDNNNYVIDLFDVKIKIEKIEFELLSDDILSDSYPQDRYKITIIKQDKIIQTLHYTGSGEKVLVKYPSSCEGLSAQQLLSAALYM